MAEVKNLYCKFMYQTVNENAYGLKGNNPVHKLRILKVFRVKNGIYKCLREI